MNVTFAPFADTLAVADKIVTALQPDLSGVHGGITIGRFGKEAPTKGFVVGSAHGITTLKLPTTTQIDTAVREVARWLGTLPTKVEWVGGWVDDGIAYVDAVDIHEYGKNVFFDRNSARIYAESDAVARGELAIYDLENQETIYV